VVDKLEKYIKDVKGKYVRYMDDDLREEIEFLTPGCEGGIAERLYWIRNGLENYPRCKRCGELLSSRNFIRNGKAGYRDYCGRSCSKKDADFESINIKRHNTNKKRYGGSNPWYFENFRRYMQEEFGVEFTTGDDD